MSLQDALQRAKIERMLKEQSEILKKAESSTRKPSKVVEAIQETDIDTALKYGGVVKVNVNVNGVDKKFKVSVHTGSLEDKSLPEFKFHITTALGYIMYIQAKDRNTAQLIVNSIFGRGQYVVSAALI